MQQCARDLALELSNHYGMSREEIARATDLSPHRVRQLTSAVLPSDQAAYRLYTPGEDRPEEWQRLAELVALLHFVEMHCGIKEPASWWAVNFDLGDGYLWNPARLYKPGRGLILADLAAGRRKPEDVLNELEPGWYLNRSDWKVYYPDDGDPYIAARPGVQPTEVSVPVEYYERD